MFKLGKQYSYLLIGSIIFLVGLFFLTRNVPFFWDAVAVSQSSSWLYEHNFSQFVVPTEMNPGHLPLWETLITLGWKISERSVEISRLVLLFCNIAVFWQLLLFIKSNKSLSLPIWATVIVLIEPTLLAQTTNINNDMLLLFFTLLGLNSIYKNQKIIYFIALTGVLFTNLRGISIFASLFVIDFLFYWFKLKENKQSFQWISYIPSLIIFGLFLAYQQSVLGWILKTPGHSHREMAGIYQILKNNAAIAKSVLESGRIFMFFPLGILMVYLFKKKKWIDIANENKRLIICLFSFFIIFSVLFMVMTNPLGPRYYMVCFLIATLLFLNLIFDLIHNLNKKRFLLAFVALGFLTGHLWIWPATISQAWDSTFAYLNYFPIKNKMEIYISEKDIDRNEIGANLNFNKELTELKPSTEKEFSELDLSRNRYVLLSNIENSTTDKEIHILRNSWKLEKSFSQMGVFINLYSRPEN